MGYLGKKTMKELHTLYEEDKQGSTICGENPKYRANIFSRTQKSIFPKKTMLKDNEGYTSSVMNVSSIDGDLLYSLEEFMSKSDRCLSRVPGRVVYDFKNT